MSAATLHPMVADLLVDRRPLESTLASEAPVTDEKNATVRETFRVHYAGRIGSTSFVRHVDAGERVYVSDVDVDAGLCRVHLNVVDEQGALVHLDHVDVDDSESYSESVRTNGYRP